MALPQEIIDAEVSLLQKCTINWKILKINLWKKQWCFQDISIILKWDKWYYNLYWDIIVEDCTYDVIYEKFNKYFVKQVWKNIKFLIEKNSYTIISKEDYDLKKYAKLEVCKTNLQETKELQNIYYKFVLQDYKKEIFNSSHTIYYLWIFVIILSIQQ